MPGLAAADAVQNGTVEMCHTASYYYFGQGKKGNDDDYRPQFRAPRAMLGWTVRELGQRAIVSVATVNAIEDTNVPSSHRKVNWRQMKAKGKAKGS